MKNILILIALMGFYGQTQAAQSCENIFLKNTGPSFKKFIVAAEKTP